MKNEIKTVLCLAGIAGGLMGCSTYRAPFEPPAGTVVSSYKAPLSTEGNFKDGSKTGSSSAMNVLGIVTVGDCSLATAMRNGGIKTANYADYEYFNILGFYQKITIHVTGE